MTVVPLVTGLLEKEILAFLEVFLILVESFSKILWRIFFLESIATCLPELLAPFFESGQCADVINSMLSYQIMCLFFNSKLLGGITAEDIFRGFAIEE